jgi:hypothetical protein
MLDFREILGHCDLHDLGFAGVLWTFNNNQEGDRNVRVRLDHAVVSASWSDRFPQVAVKHIASSRSDHPPILLELEGENVLNRAPQIRRYKVMWERLDSLPGEIKKAWESTGWTLHNLGDIATSLRDVMTSLKRWSKENSVQ